MVRGAVLVELEPGANLFRVGIVLSHSQGQGAPGGFHGLGELAGLGVGGGQRVEIIRILPAGEPVHLPGQLDGFDAVAQRGLRTGGQQPGQIVSRPQGSGLDNQGLLIMSDGLGPLPLWARARPRL